MATMNLNPKTTAILNQLIAKATELHQQAISAQIAAGELNAENAQYEPIYHYFDAHGYDKGRGDSAIMGVSVERTEAGSHYEIWCVSHPYIQDGDLIDNPAVWFLRSRQGGLVFPIRIQTPFYYSDCGVKIDLNSHESVVNKAGCIELSEYCKEWMANIQHQQNMKKW